MKTPLPRRTRRARLSSSAEPPLEVSRLGGAMVLRFAAELELPEMVAVLLDGQFAGTGPVIGREATVPMVAGRGASVLEVAGVPEGRAIARLDVRERMRLVWLGWQVERGRISGGFRFEGDLTRPPEGPIAVQVLHDGALPRTCFAQAEPDSEGAAGRAWRFATPIARLAHLGQPFTLTALVGGVPAGGPLSVTYADCGYAGHLDVADGAVVQGWAVDLADPKRRIEIEVVAAGAVLWRGRAQRQRDDIAALGLSDGASGFYEPMPKGLPRREPLPISATIAGTGIQLVHSPVVVPPPPPVKGFFDALEGPFAGGWAVNMYDPDVPLEVEAVCGGQVIGSGRADLFRGDVEKAGMPTARCGFRFLLERPLAELFDRDIHLRVVGTDLVLGGSPRQISQNSNIVRFLTRGTTLPPPTLQRLIRRITHRTLGTRISIVMPVYNTKREWLFEALNSVLGQWSPHWELICVDDGSTAPHVREILDAAVRHDPRIRVMRAPGNLGIARATNFGLRAARGDYVAFMDHDDTIEPDAVYKLALAAKQSGADLVYSDEAITTDDIGSVIEVRARPAFSYDYYLSHPYFVHLVCVRTELAQRLGGWDESLPISADVDFILRVIEQARVVAHVPSVLYRWRTHSTSTGHAKQAEVTETMTALLTRHLARRGLPAVARPGMRYNEYRIDWPDDGGEVLIVIPTKNRVDLLRTCIDSIEKTSMGANYRIVVIDHDSKDKRTVKYLAEIAGRHTVMPYSGVFNYALMNNLAVKTHGGAAEYLLFMNNDVEAREDGWLPRLRSLVARPDVGAVGCLLLYGDDRVQHAGVLVGFSGAADHAMKFQDAYLEKGSRHPGYNCSLTSVRDYSAVTAACVMIKREAFRKVRGFDERFVIGFNDTDLCLRIGEAGYKVLYDGFTVLYHHESATRTTSNEVDHPEDDARLRKRWRRYFTKGDPFYSPMLAPRGTDHTLRQDAGCKGRMGARAMQQNMAEVPRPARRKRSIAGATIEPLTG